MVEKNSIKNHESTNLHQVEVDRGLGYVGEGLAAQESVGCRKEVT